MAIIGESKIIKCSTCGSVVRTKTMVKNATCNLKFTVNNDSRYVGTFTNVIANVLPWSDMKLVASSESVVEIALVELEENITHRES